MVSNKENALLWRATTLSDRWLILLSALLIGSLAVYLFRRPAGEEVIVERHNEIVLRLPLSRNQVVKVQGALGEVAVQVQEGRVRLLEYASPRMIGTRSGWISRAGAMVACVPCDILLRVTGENGAQTSTNGLDAISR
ncbi:MAG: NusG domain II-containing protein [Magnetococcales bacterium]|nr:NusG domain II-containing protein [Magnetococcales bacterium]